MLDEIRSPFWHPANMKAFILDWDGVLANTRLNFMPIRQKYFEGKTVPLIESAESLPSPLREKVQAEIRKIEMDGASEAQPIDGARDFIRWLEENGKPWAVVSRNCRDSILLAAKSCGIDLPRHVLSREDPAVKPEPEALRLAAERLNIPLEECVMVGDFIYDILGARRASVRCALVERKEAEWQRLADIACDTMRDFLDVLKAPEPLIPWEYRDIAERRGQEEGKRYLREINRYVWILPSHPLRWALTLAERGVVNMAMERTAKLSLAEWERFHLPAPAIDRPLLPLLNEMLSAHWPCVRVQALEDLPEESLRIFAPDASDDALISLLECAANGIEPYGT